MSRLMNAQEALSVGDDSNDMHLPKTLIPIAAAAVIGGGVGAVATDALHSESQASTVQVASSGSARPVSNTSGTLSPHDVYQQAKDSVAYITAQITQSSGGPFGQTQTGTATGSGFVVSKDGYIVTNDHVVDGASKVQVKIGDGKTLDAKVVGTDASTDLALLKVDASNLTPLTLGDSSHVEVGDPAYAIGNPYGLDRTLTTGVISALQRQISSPNGYTINDVLQTDAAINPGNSGGPLFNAQGQVIGVNSQIETSGSSSDGEGGNVGIGFAIPSNTVKSVVEQLMNSGKVSHAYLGVQSSDGQNGGAQVAQVTSGSPAQSAGLRQGDTITSIDGTSIASSSALSSIIDTHKPGDTVQLKVDRNGSEKTVTVKLGQRPNSAETSVDTSSQQEQDPGLGQGLGGGW
jgi:putative serine protease PepD